MIVYTKTRVAAPSFLFTVGTVTRVIVMVMLLMLLRLTNFLSLCIGPEHGLHKGHTLISPKLCVALLGLSGCTCCCHKELTIAVIATAVQGVVGLVAAAVGFAMMAKLLTVSFLWDLFFLATRRAHLGAALGIRTSCCSLALSLELLILHLNHDSLNSF
jgi:hypothetical protein